MGTYTFTGGDPYAGLTYTTQNFDIDENGVSIDWTTWTSDGLGNPLVYTDSLNGSSPATEVSRKIRYLVNGSPTEYRCEHEIRQHLAPVKSQNYQQFFAEDNQYAIAYPITLNVQLQSDDSQALADNLNSGTAQACILFQFHYSEGGTQPPFYLCVRNDGDLVAYWDKATGGGDEEVTVITDMQCNQRYEIVVAYYQDSDEVTPVDVMEVWVDGTLKASKSEYLFDGPDRGAPYASDDIYVKHGVYWGQNNATTQLYRAILDIHMDGFGHFAGTDAIAAAKIRVTETG